MLRTALILTMTTLALTAASLTPRNLRLEYRTNPLGIDVAQPRLSWRLEPTNPKAQALRQTAYRILVATSPQSLAAGKPDLWDTGKVSSDQSIHIPYNGKPLASQTHAFWKVMVWDQDGQASPWSEPAHWSMGLLNPTDWKAKWIGRDEPTLYKNPTSPYHHLSKAKWIWSPEKTASASFQTTFSVNRPVTKAIVVMGAAARFELTLNGTLVGQGRNVEMPDLFHVTELIRQGENTVSVKAQAPGRNAPAGLIGALRVEFDSGDPLLVVTGRDWQATELGPYGMAPWGEVGFTEERALPARMLRKEFTIQAPVTRATAYISGLGLSELYLNGTRIGTDVLSPNLTEYDKRVFYVTYDVTQRLTPGRNAVGVILGNGRYWGPRERAAIISRSFGYPKLRLQLEIETAAGKTTIVSDESWKLTTNGPIRANNEYDGEEYDARMEIPNWSRAGFNDASWEPARLVEGPKGSMAAQMAEPLRVVETLKPVKVTEPRKGVWIFDMGQNMVGWCRLRVSGPKGTQVSIRHAETLRPDGTLYVDNLRTARATDLYTLKGGGPEVWEPRFTYHGFRYVELRGFPGKPALTALEGRVVHDDMRRIADFETSDSLLNRIHKNIVWGVRGNYRSIPTDCPQRDERQGWLGDRSVVSRSESYLFDVGAFYTKFITDIADSQRPSGSVPNVSPAYWVLYSDNVTWPSTFVLAPGMLYDQYGDLRAIETNYPAMKKWIDYMKGFLKDGLMPKDTYGDWCVPPESPELIHSKDPARVTDGTLIGTAYYYEMLRLMARYARLLNKSADAAGFDSLAAQVRTAFQQRFFKPGRNIYDNGTQTSSVLPLSFRLTPEENRTAVFEGLVNKIEKESNNHIGVGLVGAQWLMRTLSEYGRPDLAFTIATQKTYPGWGYMVEKGATTVWELWNGDTADPAMNSGNHVMQIGDLNVWFYEYLAGIRPDPEKPGFKHILIRPYPVKGLTYVRASHESMYGRIATHWRTVNGRFHLEVTIPPNTTATVHLPGKGGTKEIGSGAYAFDVQMN
jgi:alpha-L-rhamnosidase